MFLAVCCCFTFSRFYTAVLFHGSILHLLFNMLALVPMGSALERIMGSIRLLYVIILLATSNAILHLLLALVIAHNPIYHDQSLMDQCSIGFSGILFSMIIIEISIRGIQHQSVFGLFNVPANLYVWILLVVFQLLMTNVSLLGHLCGILSGYAYTFGLFNILIPGSSFYSSIESKNWLSCCVRRPKFIMCTGSNFSGYIPTHTSPSASASRLFSANTWRNLSSWMPQRENAGAETEQDTRFPGRGRTLGSSTNQAASAVSPDADLQTRLLDDNSNLAQVPDQQNREGGRPVSDWRINPTSTPNGANNNQVSEEEIQKLVAMGFDRTQIEVAVAASDGDLTTAVEILMSQQG